MSSKREGEKNNLILTSISSSDIQSFRNTVLSATKKQEAVIFSAAWSKDLWNY